MRHLIIILFLLSLCCGTVLAADNILGEWTMLPQHSTEIDLFATLSLDLQYKETNMTVLRTWGRGSRSKTDTLVASMDGSVQLNEITDRVFATNVFMGLSMAVGTNQKTRGMWLEPHKAVEIEEICDVISSQGQSTLTTRHSWQLSDNGETLHYTINRPGRPDSASIQYVFKRKGTREACYIKLEDDWRIDAKLDQNVLLITLQALANLNNPSLYFIYPETWDFNYTKAIFDFYQRDRFYTFKQLKSCEDALKIFRKNIKGYVVWDKNVRTSLIVAFTVAGLEEAVVVSEAQIPLMEKFDIKAVADFRNKYNGMNDYEIYSQAYEEYWPRCSKNLIIWMGGHHGNIMKPGVADWGIYNKAFFNDLSTKPSDKEEYRLASKLLGELDPMSMVMGWHSYKKDKERDHVRLTSSYGHRVKGLHTLPNTSFSAQVTMTPGFTFRNNHNVVQSKTYKPDKKVYVTCVQTDGVGLGAWTKPGRGEIPYAWCLGLNDLWMSPAMLEFYYREATPNDYFIGGTTPGYMYPKMIPDSLRPQLFSMAQKMLNKMDLKITQTMDYSEGATVEGNTELTCRVVEDFYKYLPGVQGFLNGYAPAFTFAIEDKIPLVSYDYYLSPERPVGDAVADFHELAEINQERPYFLVAHIRQWSDIKRVKTILEKLGPEFQVIPLDLFIKMAGEAPTWEERCLQR
ncbi:hypothetical protein GF407_05030 [candidate division KSB1 bacterium]|nr:hypothetical protein [candidate division KSB1 bacterium]